MNLKEHAQFELDRAGLFDKDSDYNGAIGPAVMKMIEVFRAEGHSGYSAMMTLDIFDRLAHFKALTKLTSNPDEWTDVSEVSGQKAMWQSKRQSSCFSKDGGRTFYDIEGNDDCAMHKTESP